MSTENIHSIISRAVREPSFRSLLFSDPGAALAGYTLSDAEAAMFKGLTAENFDAMTSELGERISRASVSSGNFENVTGISALLEDQSQFQ